MQSFRDTSNSSRSRCLRRVKSGYFGSTLKKCLSFCSQRSILRPMILSKRESALFYRPCKSSESPPQPIGNCSRSSSISSKRTIPCEEESIIRVSSNSRENLHPTVRWGGFGCTGKAGKPRSTSTRLVLYMWGGINNSVFPRTVGIWMV